MLKGLNLYDAEIVHLLAHGSVLLVRPITPQPQSPCSHVKLLRAGGRFDWVAGDNTGRVFRCHYGVQDEERFVREAWAPFEDREGWLWALDQRAADLPRGCTILYEVSTGLMPVMRSGKWRPASQMPEWASRARVRCESVNACRFSDLPLAPPLRRSWREHFEERYPCFPWVWVMRWVRVEGEGVCTP
jgi:hypothetical protein